jgi:2-iminobutanoate/2-iminopropanoate deaminase
VVPVSGAPFSQMVTDDRYAYLAGLVAADFPAGQAVMGHPGEETTAVMQAISKILNELGLNCSDIVRVDVHLSDLDYFDQMDKAYRSFFEGEEFPARTTTESPRLFGGASVEITVQARLRD